MKRILITLTTVLVWVSPVSAATPFYEFSPDYAQSLLVASSDTVSQVFLPLNDYLGSFDVWVSNANTPGDVVFSLHNSSGNVIATRTVAVPAIADSEHGTPLHVGLPVQLPVTSSGIYSVQVSTVVPTLRLYYGDVTRILSHNGVPLPQYTGGLARIGSEDKGFSFLFALYENAESTAPVLSGVAVSQPDISQVIISFNANEPVDRRVQFGSDIIDWTAGYSSCVATIQPCTVSLNVTPGVVYPYTLTVRDIWGNEAQATGTFTSLGQGQSPSPGALPSSSVSPTPVVSTPVPTPDTQEPVLSNVRIVNLTGTSADVAWTTSEAANSFVVVQDPDGFTAGGGSDATFELEHLIPIAGLGANSAYIAQLTSSDASGNISRASVSFQTQSATGSPTPPPAISATPTPTAAVTTSSAGTEVAWTPPGAGEPSDGYRVDVFDENNNLIKTVLVPAGQHRTTLGILPNGDNRIIVYAGNEGTFEKVATASTARKVPLTERLIGWSPYILIGFVLILGIVIGIIKLRPKKTPPPVVIPPSTAPTTTSP